MIACHFLARKRANLIRAASWAVTSGWPATAFDPGPGGGAAAHHRNGVHLGGKDRWSACVRWNFKIYMALPEHSSLIAEE